MTYPSPITYPGLFTYPGTTASDYSQSPIALGNLVINTVDGNGTKWSVTSFDGWASPASSAQFTQRARRHGATGTEPFYTGRVMALKGFITATTPAFMNQAINDLNAAVTLTPFRMAVTETGTTRWCMAQRQGEVIVQKKTSVFAAFSLQLMSTDPLKYGDPVTVSTGLPNSSGGRTYPARYPLTYTGVSATGMIRITNPGNETAPVWLRIDGPLPAGGWSVTHIGTGNRLTFGNSLALGSGEFLTVDMQSREVLAQGQASRAGYVTSRGWFGLDPGPNDIAFSSTVYGAQALLTVTTYPAWS